MRFVIIFIVKTVLELALVFMVFRESGVWTALFALVAVIGFEVILTLLNSMMKIYGEASKLLAEKIIKVSIPIDKLKFKTNPLSVEETLLGQQLENGNLNAVIGLLHARCENKDFDFGKMQMSQLDSVMTLMVEAINLGIQKQRDLISAQQNNAQRNSCSHQSKNSIYDDAETDGSVILDVNSEREN